MLYCRLVTNTNEILHGHWESLVSVGCAASWLLLKDADPIRPGFCGAVPIMRVLNNCASVPQISFLGHQTSGVFPQVKKKIHFWQRIRKFWLSDSGWKHVQHWGSHQPATDRKERERQREMCRLVERQRELCRLVERQSVDWECEEFETDMYRKITKRTECLSLSGNTTCYSNPRMRVIIFMTDFSAVISELLLLIAWEVKNFVICLHLFNPKCYESSGFWVCEKMGLLHGSCGKVACSIPASVIGIFLWHKILPIALCPWGRLSL
jgi:hypothetical protein